MLTGTRFASLVSLLQLLFMTAPAMADDDPMSPMYEMELPEPQADLAARPLAGKFIRYGYHSFWEVNKDRGVRGAPDKMVHDILFYENGECEWFSLDIFAGEHARMRCGTVEVAPNLYQVSWLEPATRQVVTQLINLNQWTINTSFHFNNGKGLALWQGKVFAFGAQPVPPVTIPDKY